MIKDSHKRGINNHNKRTWKSIPVIALTLTLTACADNPDAASIRRAYVEEKQAELERTGEETVNGLAQAGKDISTAAGIGAENVKNETSTFFQWFFDDMNGEWEYMKLLLTTPNSEIDSVIAKKEEFVPGDDEYRLDEPEETALGYLSNSKTAENIAEALGDIEEKGEEISGKAADAIEDTVNDLNSDTSAPGNIIKKAGETAREQMEEGVEDIKELISNAEVTESFSVEPFSGAPYTIVNNNKPFFTEDELKSTEAKITLTDLDYLGRCGPATELIDKNYLPKEQRGEIGMVKPSGWNQAKYDSLKNEENPAGYLYARCHLLAYCLSGLNAEPRNLITGSLTQFNVLGMEPFELQTLYYVKSTGNHVLYRVTPLFRGNNLLADGVLMEAQSIEDNGLSFCVFVYNDPGIGSGISIDYLTGKSRAH